MVETDSSSFRQRIVSGVVTLHKTIWWDEPVRQKSEDQLQCLDIRHSQTYRNNGILLWGVYKLRWTLGSCSFYFLLSFCDPHVIFCCTNCALYLVSNLVTSCHGFPPGSATLHHSLPSSASELRLIKFSQHNESILVCLFASANHTNTDMSVAIICIQTQTYKCKRAYGPTQMHRHIYTHRRRHRHGSLHSTTQRTIRTHIIMVVGTLYPLWISYKTALVGMLINPVLAVGMFTHPIYVYILYMQL